MVMKVTPRFSTRMKYERMKRGISQHKLAVLTELQQADVSKIKNRRLVPGPRQAERISRALKIPSHELQQPVEIVEAAG
jgi:ribosome-binding protein aMBF1 (putative translation factor)